MDHAVDQKKQAATIMAILLRKRWMKSNTHAHSYFKLGKNNRALTLFFVCLLPSSVIGFFFEPTL